MFGTYRTFLALMVVALHIGGVPKIGAYAVFGFYCLSGYLMTLIMQTNYGYTKKGAVKYAVNRFLRIYPIYWVSIIISTVLIWSLGSEFTSQYHRSIYFPEEWSAIFKNILLFFPFRESPRLTPPAWALTVEIFFYILIGIGISKNKGITIIWFTLSVLYHVVALTLQLGWSDRYFTIPAASLPFSTGALIYHYRSECIQYISTLLGRLYKHIPYIIILAILTNWAVGHFSSQSEGAAFYSNFILCSLMVVVLSDKNKLPFISRKFDKLMGDFSYPIYLIHYQVGIVVIILLSAAGIEAERPGMILMLASIPVLFSCSWVIIVSLERPIEIVRAKVKS